MPENVTAQRKITFTTGLPLGRHATFTHDNERWVAVPAAKQQAERAVTDRLIAVLDNVRHHLTTWVSRRPDDADRVVLILELIARADEVVRQSAVDKTIARTA